VIFGEHPPPSYQALGTVLTSDAAHEIAVCSATFSGSLFFNFRERKGNQNCDFVLFISTASESATTLLFWPKDRTDFDQKEELPELVLFSELFRDAGASVGGVEWRSLLAA
jgi:hypothetical protein